MIALLKTLTVIISIGFSASSLGVTPTQLVYGETGRVDTFDPYTIHEASGQRLADLLFDSLVEVDPSGEYLPSLAKSWEINKNGTEVTFVLRKDVVWHESKEQLSPDDVVTTIRLLQAAKSEIPNKDRFHILHSASKSGPR